MTITNISAKIKTIDLLAIALAMSVGWGFRGNYGHEYGALVPGALVAIAVCLASGREDWYRRVAFFGLFGAVGWAFGGQMSYGIVIGYTKASDWLSVFYGFGGLFLIGLLWGAVGAGILALVLILDQKKLTQTVFPFIIVFAVWSVINIILLAQYGDTEPAISNYYDTDWIAAVGALLALVLVISIQRKVTQATSLGLHLTLGWICGVLFFVTLLDWHLSPPRSDNWAGMVGLWLGLLLFLIRNKYWSAVYASLLVGIFSGIGFSCGQLFAVLGGSTGIRIDWWKIMEQSFGFITGLGVALTLLRLRHSVPRFDDGAFHFNWAHDFAILFLLIAMPYVNLEQNVGRWIQNEMVGENIFGLSPHFWFNLSYAMIAVVVMIFLQRSRRRKLVFLPESIQGRGVLLFGLVLWWAIIGDQFSALLKFNYGKLIVEGSFFISAILLTLWIGMRLPESISKISDAPPSFKSKSWKLALILLLVWPAVMLLNTTLARLVHSEPLGGAHSRFVKAKTTVSTVTFQEAIVKAEFIYQEAPFPECHASTIAETGDGLIAAWFGGTEERDSDVGIWISRNAGAGWSEVLEVANGIQNDSLRYACWNPVLFQPKAGPLMLFYKVGPNPREWWGMLITSNDGGNSWTEPQRLPDPLLGPIKNKPIQLADGTLLCPSSTEFKALGWQVFMELTPDLGQTWQMVGPLNDGKIFGAIQPTILTYPDGRLQILCRSQQGRITECWSNDNGRTWSSMKLTDLPNPNSGIDGVTLNNGWQLLVYNHTEKGRSPLNVAISKDGKAWKMVVVLEDQPGEYSYPAVIQTSDGKVHITYTWKREKIKHVALDPSKTQFER